jgi:hypothetical protein
MGPYSEFKRSLTSDGATVGTRFQGDDDRFCDRFCDEEGMVA